jgi:hypothetical protein
MDLFSFWVILGFDLMASCLLGRHSITWAFPVALVALVILEIGSFFLSKPAWTYILFYTSHHHWDDRCMPPSSAFFFGSFYPGWPGTTIPPISASHVGWDDRCVPLHPAIGWLFFAWAGLKLWSSWSQPPKKLGLQAWAISSGRMF